MMSNFNTELSDFAMEVDETVQNVFEHHHNLEPAHDENVSKQVQSLQEQNALFYTNNLQMNNCHGEDLKNVRNIVPSSTNVTDDYSELELNKYLNYIGSPVKPCQSTQFVENGKNESIDEFFQDFYEIISSEMKTPSKAHEQSVATLDPSHMLTFDDQSKNFNPIGSDVDFNLDLTQFYVDGPHESDLMMLQSPGVASSFSSDLQPDAYNEHTHHDSPSPATIQHSNRQEASEYSHVNTDTLENGHLKQFYADFRVNGDVATVSNEDNSLITYMKNTGVQSIEYINDNGETETITYVAPTSNESVQSIEYINDNGKTDSVMYVDQASNDWYKEGVQSLEYINDNGETETVMYVDQASNGLSKEGVQTLEYINENGETVTVVYVDQASNDQSLNSNAADVTQYEIIDYNAYGKENTNSTLQNNHFSLPVEDVNSNKQVMFQDQSHDICQPDLLTLLLSDKKNKVTIIAKPLKNPKIRQVKVEFHSKLNEIYTNRPNIPFLKLPRTKGCRKQTLGLINQVDSPLPKKTEKRKRSHQIIEKWLSTPTPIAETPKRSSKYMRDRKRDPQARRRKPRKLIWDSESDYETENINVEENRNY